MFVLNCSSELRAKLGLDVPPVLVLPREPHIVVCCGAGQRCSVWPIDEQISRRVLGKAVSLRKRKS